MVNLRKGPWRYVDKYGVERICTDPGESGIFASSLSPEIKDYQDKLKAIALGRRGMEKKDVAERLNRSAKWVQKWWREEPMTLRKPKGATYADPNEWRDCEFQRGFAGKTDIYRKLVERVEWHDAVVVKRNAQDGGRSLEVQFDKEGNKVAAKRKCASYNGEVPELDAVVSRLCKHLDLEEDLARVFMNWYPDGENVTGNHRHNAWTALLSFGGPRILQVDHKPYVMFDGDLIVFGQQMHGVPKMPDATNEGRISVVLFFHPTEKHMAKQWQTINEEDEPPVKSSPSRPPAQTQSHRIQTQLDLDESFSVFRQPRVYLLPDMRSSTVFAGMERWECGTLWDLICRTASHETAAKSRVLQYRTLPSASRPANALQFLCSPQGQGFLEKLTRDAPCAVVCTSAIDGSKDWRRCDLTQYLAEALVQRQIEVYIVDEDGKATPFVNDELPF